MDTEPTEPTEELVLNELVESLIEGKREETVSKIPVTTNVCFLHTCIGTLLDYNSTRSMIMSFTLTRVE